jgi:hypothetical protein
MIKRSCAAFDAAGGGPRVPPGKALNDSELETLRRKINDEGYLHEAIQRIAWTLSSELLNISQGGHFH